MKLRQTAFEVFTQYFDSALMRASNYQVAYTIAEKEFEDQKGYAPYSSYDSYRQMRKRKLRKNG